MDKKDNFTNEKLGKKFASLFDLVNYAIRLAENMIKTGRDPRVKIESQNRSTQILAEITCDKDFFDEEENEESDYSHASNMPEERMTSFSTQKPTEKRRARKIFGE